MLPIYLRLPDQCKPFVTHIYPELFHNGVLTLDILTLDILTLQESPHEDFYKSISQPIDSVKELCYTAWELSYRDHPTVCIQPDLGIACGLPTLGGGYAKSKLSADGFC